MPSFTKVTTALAIAAGFAEAYWQPTPGLSWNYQLSVIPTTNPGSFQVWDIDLYDTSAKTIAGLKNNGAKVICYFSAGTWEDWRPDAKLFRKNDLGNDMEDWEGERWLKTSSSNVRSLMSARLDLAKSKGCDGVDPDNIDAYHHDTGFDLSEDTAVSYVTYLAEEAHARDLAIGLKNSADIVGNLVKNVDYAVNEQCAEYSECNSWQPFIKANKPVFRVEYPKGESSSNSKVSTSKMSKVCSAKGSTGFSTIIKNMNLNAWFQLC